MARPALPLALAVLLAAPLAGAAWEQPGGPERSHTAAAYPQLDVLAAYNATHATGPYVVQDGPVETPSGIELVAAPLVQDTGQSGAAGQPIGQCALLVSEAAGPRVLASFDCTAGASLVGRVGDVVLVCVAGDPRAPLLRALRASDGGEAWSLPTGVTTGVGDPSDPNAAWGCGHPAIDGARDRLVVPYSNALGANRVVAYRLGDRAPLWNLTLTAAANTERSLPLPIGPGLQESPCAPSVPGTSPPQPLLPSGVQLCREAMGNVRFGSATLTASGVLLVGTNVVYSATATGVQSEVGQGVPFLAWADPDGHLVGVYGVAELGVTGSDAGVSALPAVSGPRAALVVGTQLLLIDPGQRDVALTATLGPSSPDAAAPAWSRDGLTVPQGQAAWLCSERDPTHCIQWTDQAGHVDAVLGVGDGTAWLAVHRPAANGRTTTEAVRVRLDDGTSLQRIPLPLARMQERQGLYVAVRLLPLANGDVLATSHDGDAVLLGAAEESLLPLLTVEDDHPRARQEVTVEAAAQDGAPPLRAVLVGWGDGLMESFAPGAALTRSFPTPGDREVRVTFVYADNRTATSLQVLHVGQQRAPVQGLLGVLFGPEYQNYTFFVIGILVTVVGSVATAMGVARGRKRIDRRLRELDAIQEAGRRDPFAAVRDLHTYRLERRRDLAHGHLDDTQYTVLEAHADKVLQVLRQRILGAFVGRVSDAFSHALDTALADGAFDGSEAEQLLARVADEQQLDAQEKERLRGLIAAWRLGDARSDAPAFVLPRERKEV